MATTGGSKPSTMANKRIQKEIQRLESTLPPEVSARPHPNNILEFHFVVRGPVDTPFEGGYYYGVLYLPNEYPMKPPDIVLLTPSGRFQPGAKICMSITAFHQESWNPAWGIATILKGFVSFMVDDGGSHHIGKVDSTKAQKKDFAKKSMAYNKKQPTFMELFPDIVAEAEGTSKPKAAVQKPTPASSSSSSASASVTTADADDVVVVDDEPAPAKQVGVPKARSASSAGKRASSKKTKSSKASAPTGAADASEVEIDGAVASTSNKRRRRTRNKSSDDSGVVDLTCKSRASTVLTRPGK